MEEKWREEKMLKSQISYWQSNIVTKKFYVIKCTTKLKDENCTMWIKLHKMKATFNFYCFLIRPGGNFLKLKISSLHKLLLKLTLYAVWEGQEGKKITTHSFLHITKAAVCVITTETVITFTLFSYFSFLEKIHNWEFSLVFFFISFHFIFFFISPNTSVSHFNANEVYTFDVYAHTYTHFCGLKNSTLLLPHPATPSKDDFSFKI